MGRSAAQLPGCLEVDVDTLFYGGQVDPFDVRVLAFAGRAVRDCGDAGGVGQSHVHPVGDSDDLGISGGLRHYLADRMVGCQVGWWTIEDGFDRRLAPSPGFAGYFPITGEEFSYLSHTTFGCFAWDGATF